MYQCSHVCVQEGESERGEREEREREKRCEQMTKGNDSVVPNKPLTLILPTTAVGIEPDGFIPTGMHDGMSIQSHDCHTTMLHYRTFIVVSWC